MRFPIAKPLYPTTPLQMERTITFADKPPLFPYHLHIESTLSFQKSWIIVECHADVLLKYLSFHFGLFLLFTMRSSSYPKLLCIVCFKEKTLLILSLWFHGKGTMETRGQTSNWACSLPQPSLMRSSIIERSIGLRMPHMLPNINIRKRKLR